MASILLVDGNTFVWRAAYGGQYEGIARTVITYIYEMLGRFLPMEVVICWDKGKSRWRSEQYPEYKAHRVEKKKADELDLEKVQEQANYVRRYFSAVGVRQILVPGVEADDVISWLTEYYQDLHREGRFSEQPDFHIIISTGDHDLWQLVGGPVLVYDHSKGLVIDAGGVLQATGVTPALIPDMKSLSGDASDNLPGVKGVGDVTAAKLLVQYGGVGVLMTPEEGDLKEIRKKKAQSRIYDDPDLVSEMYRLVKLPTLCEARCCLNEEEFKLLEQQATAPLKRNDFDLQMMHDRVGRSFDSSVLPKQSLDLGNMVDRMTIQWCEEEFHYLEDVDRVIQSCHGCALRADCGARGPTLPSGYKDADIMVVGRNPGEQERDQGVPFYSGAPAGSRLDEFLKNVGLTRRECWITNVCKCYSAANRPPTHGEIMTCLPYLRAEIALIRPKLIITFGVEAMAALTPYQSRITKHCGEILHNPSGGLVGSVEARVALVVHPSAARRSTQSETEMKYAETQVKALLEKVTR